MKHKIQIGDIVEIDGELYDYSYNIKGVVENVFSNFIRIKTDKCTHYSVQKVDFDKITVLSKSNFEAYNIEQFKKDLEEAVKNLKK